MTRSWDKAPMSLAVPLRHSPTHGKGTGWGSYFHPKYLELTNTRWKCSALSKQVRANASWRSHSSEELSHKIVFKLLFLSRVFTCLTLNRLWHFCKGTKRMTSQCWRVMGSVQLPLPFLWRGLFSKAGTLLGMGSGGTGPYKYRVFSPRNQEGRK